MCPCNGQPLLLVLCQLCACLQARFLSGEDGGADADAESSLDDDWEKERAQDSEDKYFES